MKHLLDIKPDGGTYIYSALRGLQRGDGDRLCEALALARSLQHHPGRVLCGGGGRRQIQPVFEREFHATGHASREDLTEVIDKIDPDLIVPIHAESREWFADNFENVVLAEEGVAIEF